MSDAALPTSDATASSGVTAVIVNYNTRTLLGPCIAALRAAAGSTPLQIVIVDNASRDGSPEVLRRDHSDCDLLFNDVNVGFGRANNQALALARGRYVLLLNTDAFVAADTLDKTVAFLEAHPSCGVLGVRLVGRDGSLQPSCRFFPTPWNEFVARAGLAGLFPGTRLVDDMAWDHRSVRECDWVPGCYYLVRRSVIDAVGLFDPRYFLYFEEVDHCRAVKAAGWSVMFYPETTVVHIGGESAKSEAPINQASRQIDALQIESSLLYVCKHHGRGGLLAAVLLTTLADALIAVKTVVRPGRHASVGACWAHVRATWRLLQKTSFGRLPTR